MDCRGAYDGGCSDAVVEGGGWDQCGVCYGGDEDLQGCGCFNPPPVEWYKDTDADLYFDNPQSFCGVVCETGSCDGTTNAATKIQNVCKAISEHCII